MWLCLEPSPSLRDCHDPSLCISHQPPPGALAALPHAQSCLEPGNRSIAPPLLCVSVPPCPRVPDPSLLAVFPISVVLPVPSTSLVWITTQCSVTSPAMVTDACWLLAPPTSPMTPRALPPSGSRRPFRSAQGPWNSPERLLQDHALLLQPCLSGLCCLALPSIHHSWGEF